MRTNFIYILIALFVLNSCVEENFKGDFVKVDGEVTFRAKVGKTSATKTVYGDIADNKQAVYWTHNDQITVFGANCHIQQADYTVSVSNTDAEGNTSINKEQNYASDLTKSGSYGVQWGNVAQTDFYAVYPVTSNSFEAEIDDNVTEETTLDGDIVNVVTTKSATVTANISTTQNVYFTMVDKGNNAKGWSGVHYTDDVHNPSAQGALMYACTSGATAVDENGNEKQVDLQFHPFSTVLRFSFAGFQVMDESNTNIDYSSSVYVNSIVLTAPSGVGVAGDFSLTINNDATETTAPTATAGNGSSNVITVIPSDPIPLETHQSVEFDVFTIPQKYTMSSENLWTVTLNTSGGAYTYKMIPKVINEDNTATQTTATLAAGKIHNLNIPQLTVTRPAFEIPDDSWIEYIPRNVYLSELSMPGAWYSTNPDYQGESTLQSLYSIGVRAFNIDCRMTASADSWEQKWAIVTYYELKSDPKYLLQCAGSETLEGQKIGGIERVASVADGKTVESQLETLSNLITDEEFITVVLTIAEKPKDLSGALSDESESFGNNVNPTNVLNAIKDILTRRGEEFKVFGYRDQDADKTLDANTTVNDVLGSMLIKINVNVDQDVTDLSSYGMQNVLLCEGSMASETKYTASGNATDYPNIVLGSFTSMNEAPMYWGSSKITEPEMKYYYHHAQLTTSSTTATSGTSTPSLYDRQIAIKDIVDKSYSLYKNNEHNGMFQLGIGGRIGDSNRETVASTLNSYVLGLVNEKLTTEPSPIGMVLMNYAETTGAGLCKAILEMNKKFFLNRNPEAEEWPNGNPFDNITTQAQQQSAAYVTVSGDAF